MHKVLLLQKMYDADSSGMEIELGLFKKESTNSNLLNTCKSSIPSPTPIYFTGI